MLRIRTFKKKKNPNGAKVEEKEPDGKVIQVQYTALCPEIPYQI